MIDEEVKLFVLPPLRCTQQKYEQKLLIYQVGVNIFSINIYLLNLTNGDTKKKSEIYSKLTIKAPQRRNCSSFDVNFKPISHLLLVLILLTLNR